MEILEPLFLTFIVNMAPVCLSLPYKYHVCTLLKLNMNFSVINYQDLKEVNQCAQTATLQMIGQLYIF